MKLLIPLLLPLVLVAESDPLPAIIEHQHAHSEGDAPASFNAEALAGDRKPLPIGVFDSGIGGLTVLESLLTIDAFDNANLQPRADGQRDFVAERFTYLGDQANMPYGNYAKAGRTDLLRELILRDAVWLLGSRKDKPPVKAIVIACNTATAFGLEDIRTALKEWDLDMPVVGVVEAGARGLMEQLPSNAKPDAVAVFATVGTCSCEAYPQAISRAVGLAGKPMPLILQQGSIGLAGAIEGDPAFVRADDKVSVPYTGPAIEHSLREVYGFDPAGMLGDQLNSVANHVRYEVTTLVERHRASGEGTAIGTVVLGCTHYPLVQAEFEQAFAQLRARPKYAALIKEKLAFINPAEFTAKELFRELARRQLRGGEEHKQPHDALYISVPNPEWPGVKLTATGALDADYKHARNVGDFLRADTRVVSMRPEALPDAARSAIERLMPQVWKRLNESRD